MTSVRGNRSQMWSVTAPLLVWAALILAVSSTPGQHLPEIGLWQWDKLAHAAEFAVFSWLLYRYLLIRRSLPADRVWFYCVLVGVGYGVFDELHQLFIPMRFCTWRDLVADAAGVIIGVAAAHRFYRRRGRA